MLLNCLFMYIKSMKIHLIFTDSLKGSVEKLQFLLVDGFIFFKSQKLSLLLEKIELSNFVIAFFLIRLELKQWISQSF